MRPKSMILILVALMCGLVASIGISQVVERNSGNDKRETQTRPIFVAMREMGIGEDLNASSVKLEEWPVDKIPEGAVTDASQLEGMSPNQRLFAGEPLLLGKLVDSSLAAQTSKKIKKGFRVMSVDVDMASSVSYLIAPGDRVDVMAFSDKGARAQAEVILSNIEVFAINDRVSPNIDQDAGRSMQAKTVSLLVIPSQATKLMAHNYRGRIALSLRRPDDVDELVEEEKPTVESVLAQPLPDFEDQNNEGGSFVMEVVEGGSSHSVRRFQWDQQGSMPRELSDPNSISPPLSESELPMDFPMPSEDDPGMGGIPAEF